MSEEFAPTVQNILDQRSLRWIFVGGKGGVGKTTTSCSIAVKLASARNSVLIISTDPAHNLSDAFQQKFTSTPTQVKGMDNLYAMEVDPKPAKLEVEGLHNSQADFLKDLTASIPGIDESMAFAEVMKLVNTLDYETIVFDTAPTGHTLRLMQIPSTLDKALAKLQQLQSSLGPLMGAMAGMMGGGGDSRDLFASLADLKVSVEQISNQFKDPDLTTFVCVCIPEFLSLYETERLVQELTKNDIDVHNVVINQLIYRGPQDYSPLLKARVKMQQKYVDQFEELYGEDMHLIKMPLMEEEVRGIEALKVFSNMLVQPYAPPQPPSDMNPYQRIQELEAEVADLKKRLPEL